MTDPAVAGNTPVSSSSVPGGLVQDPCHDVECVPIGSNRSRTSAAGDPALELIGGALGGQPALIEYGDTVGSSVEPPPDTGSWK